ncbi:Small nuclear ribonucleoprotein-associated protein B [Kickxella alabastrina]|uniref:Small nuclear ribonucleoprotein-associated protein B n=1 Tax=Kickxella alabastrina TaxID=61397 RepID=A0ACC1IE54_9FUNG|nr:Small nuclear ribonucleoprotein-associated protein B [Kickxella alabastrina]
MMGILNHRLRLTLLDTRVMTGQMLAFDKHMNLVLADCEEFRTIKAKGPDAKPKTQQIKRALGLVILRGEIVISISVDGPPPASAAGVRQTRGAGLTAGPGVGRPAGRGIPPPRPGAAPAGLAGPVRGVGGPSAAMMQPRAAIAAGPVSFARPPMPGMPGMPGMPPPGFRPPPHGMAPPPGFRPPPPGMMGAPPGYPAQPPPGFRPPHPGARPPPGF